VLPESATACPKCNDAVPIGGGVAAAPAPMPVPTTMPATSGMADNMAGALAYVTFIPAILFLMTAPYNQNKFIRFHSFQSIALNVVAFAGWLVLMIASGVISGLLGPLVLVMIPIDLGLSVLLFIAWLICVLKAYGNKEYKLPVLGNFAAQKANS
jgi:uncharacterized membrane protein